jgi:hypothetical protein
MKKIETGKAFTIILTADQRKEILRISNRQGWPMAKTMRVLMDAGMDQYQLFERCGGVQITDMIKRTKEALCKTIGQQRLFPE